MTGTTGITRRGFTTAAALTVASLATAGEARPAAAGKGELRGMWVATVANRDWPSRPGLGAAAQRDELLALLDTAVRRRLNAVILQVRPCADALWPSPHEPWSQVLTGTQGKAPGWDPLDTAVREAHARGLELHAWFNPYRIAQHTDPGRLSRSHPARKHPGWTVRYGGGLYYNPGLPEVRSFVREAMLDAVRRYPLDAVHWDDYFYPYPVAGQRFDDDAAFRAHGSGFASRADWRRDNVTRLVREMRAGIDKARPGCQFGISPFGIWRNAETDRRGSRSRGLQSYDDLYADTRGWVRANLVDYVCPQLYWHIGNPGADYGRLLPWWASTVRGTRVRLYTGEALYKAGDPAQPDAWQDPAELGRHLDLASRSPEVRGHVWFAGRDVVRDRSGALRRIVEDRYRERVRPPR
ncbi:family 10 glycosylhydrolase [Streptomyces sp. NA04227]|uniref:glycoside hydrolase family 10 protein n=1 Tax=Streptomyces sp. NA04227 TaxID=2742136 RepID=UPI0015922894|nr:family 10 glycosylhydrolase [Streptomyces sp. NA04227]QKW05591.1 family 10 glycosylhydrolase [Streptomyces sp. NA04227]